ncbi:FPC/CPF motif-containing protein YcgG [Crossiella equi]|uniref:FPC/CPF motif-containing protein YcgG n=1 Tax=Crossiella equi TaxID=130796 RepID=A0ABS5A6I1_9PSEU|nr:YqcI/YcgG family protein [Crossiella equi]MBP2471921.1 FPC/CPF motif-containing protein YcgG [Crossiella equi]
MSAPIQVIGPAPAWGVAAAGELCGTLASRAEPFPCTFAVSSVRKSALRFGFVEDLDDEDTWAGLPGVLTEYLRGYREIDRETALIVFFGRSGEREVEGYRDRFWRVLQYLHERDEEKWPQGVPLDTEDPEWEFGFGGTPLFVVCNTPAHSTRRSRHSTHFMVSFQPRWVFEGLGPETPRGASVRRVIRNRLRAFDGMEPSAALGDYGDPGNREWRQYFLPDVGEDGEGRCPFRHREP